VRELGISWDDPQWQTLTWEGLARSDVLRIAATEVGRHYSIVRNDGLEGVLETDWNYGLYSATTRQDIRERVFAEVEGTEEGVVLRIRVQREVNEELGRHLDPERAQWIATEDNTAVAEQLIQRVSYVLGLTLDEPATESTG
jgi:hypothetical protein